MEEFQKTNASSVSFKISSSDLHVFIAPLCPSIYTHNILFGDNEEGVTNSTFLMKKLKLRKDKLFTQDCSMR